MPHGRVLLYYITDRRQLGDNEPARRRALLDKIREAAVAGVDYIQLREKDLAVRELEALACEVAGCIKRVANQLAGPATRLLVNHRTDVALAADADGVHLRSDDLGANEVRSIWNAAMTHKNEISSPVIAISCHTMTDVRAVENGAADFIVFAPVFGKRDRPNAAPAGLAALHESSRIRIPVLALGGVTVRNSRSCLEAGAAGVAGIRLFQENKVEEVVGALRAF
jgi:thiamine-phosphate pyrophosphorylase